MRQVRSSNTNPEIVVRKLLHRRGYRFRLNNLTLPGKPDIVLPKYKIAIFVHGCFWHRHNGCRDATMPASNLEYWREKFSKNTIRDRRVKKELRRLGWRVITLWGCQVGNPNLVLERLRKTVKTSFYDRAQNDAVPLAAESNAKYTHAYRRRR